MNNKMIVAMLDSWEETDFILYKASFLGITENDMSILTPKTESINGNGLCTSPGARYLGMTPGAPIKVAEKDFMAYGDWAVLPIPGKQSNFDHLSVALKSHGFASGTVSRIVQGLRQGSTLLFMASCTKDMAEKMKALMKDTFVLDAGPSAILGQVENFRRSAVF
jgi:hypothetical protein